MTVATVSPAIMPAPAVSPATPTPTTSPAAPMTVPGVQAGLAPPATGPGPAGVEEAEAMGEELARLAGHIAAATCRFLVLLREFDAREGWHQAGILSCAHWLPWRCGMGPGTAREHVRVAKTLRDLPLTVQAFAGGRLSYSKVRALTRTARPETEADLLDIALHASAGQLERILRGVRTVTDLAQERLDHGRRALTWRWAEDGTLRMNIRLSPADGALLVQTLEQIRDRADAELAGAPPPQEEPDPDAKFGAPILIDPDAPLSSAHCGSATAAAATPAATAGASSTSSPGPWARGEPTVLTDLASR